MRRSSSRRTTPDFRALFESAPGLYLALTPDLTIAAVSEAYLRATMTRREEILGRRLFDIFPDNPDDPSATGVLNLKASLGRVLQNLAPDTMAVQKYDIRRPESEGGGFEERYWSPLNSPVLGPDRAITYIIHRVEDVTDFVRLKQRGVERDKLTDELRDRAEKMETEVYLRAQEVQEANRQLRTANEELAAKEKELTGLYEKLHRLDELKSQFFANVSHELRTPLTLILGPVGKLLAAKDLSSEARHDLLVVERNARGLLKHVNDLLDVSRLDAGRMGLAYAEIDLARLLRQTAALFESHAQELGFAYSVETPESAPAEVDPDKIQRVLMNLLSNAFKFTPPGGQIRCALRLEARRYEASRGGGAVFTVSDSGPGIPQGLREAIFERFFRVEGASTRGSGGTGLGLAIAKDFVGLHGGRINVEPGAQGGACFVVELPRKAPPGTVLSVGQWEPEARLEVDAPHSPSAVQARVPTRPENREGDDRALVLVIEDNVDMSLHIRDTLSVEYRTEGAADGAEGLSKAMHLRPDLILSDMMMPGLSGPRMIEELRTHREMDAVPVVILSARADDEVRVRLLREGAQDYILKPFSAEELLARVRNLVLIKRTRERLQGEIAERRRAEDDVRRLNLGLKRHSAQIEAANKELEAFSYSVSHDLRAPLRSIDGFSRSLLEDCGEALGPGAKEDLHRIRRAVERMGLLIDDLLKLSRITRSDLSREAVDLSALAKGVVEDFRRREPERRVTLAIQEGLTAEGDPRLLRIALENLLGNAWKFTRKKPEARIEFSLAGRNGSQAFCVRDDGAGFDMAYADKLFTPFQRLHAAGDFEGTGIGLATVARVVQRHGGRMWAEGEVGRGAAFFFTLGGSD